MAKNKKTYRKKRKQDEELNEFKPGDVLKKGKKLTNIIKRIHRKEMKARLAEGLSYMPLKPWARELGRTTTSSGAIAYQWLSNKGTV